MLRIVLYEFPFQLDTIMVTFYGPQVHRAFRFLPIIMSAEYAATATYPHSLAMGISKKLFQAVLTV